MPLVQQIAVYPKDAAALLGIQVPSGKKRLQRLRAALGKPARALISIGEFCAATGLPEQEVRAALRA